MDSMGKKSRGVGQVLFNFMKHWEENIGQIIPDTGEEDTFGDMRRKSMRTAIKLQSMGIGRGDMISTCSNNHINSCLPQLASFFIGAIPTTFDPNLPELDTVALLKLIQPQVMFISSESLQFMESCLIRADINTEIVVFGKHHKYRGFEEFLELSLMENTFTPIDIQDDRETAVILFSSGTTGNPKGTCLNHYTLLDPYCFEGIYELLSGPRSVLLVHTTLYWISGLLFLVKSIVSGARRIVCNQFDPISFWRFVEEFKVEYTFIPPYNGIDCIKYKPKNVNTKNLKLIITGGSPVTKQLMDDFYEAFPGTIILNTYGMTEAGGLISKFNPSNPEELRMQRAKPSSVGKVQPYIKWKVVGPGTGQPLGPHQQGELLIKSDLLMNGYYKKDASHVYDSEGYMRTGDIVYYDEDDCLFVVDRIKEMFKYRGWHIIPSILEVVLSGHPAVREAVVVGIPHEEDGHHPMALVILNEKSSKVTPEEILEFVNNRVSEAQKLRAGLKLITGEMPKTESGKIKRAAIRDLVLRRLI